MALPLPLAMNTMVPARRQYSPQWQEPTAFREVHAAGLTVALHGTFSCQLHLGNQLDIDNIGASYDKGVLTITVPVAQESKARRIEIGGSQTSSVESAAS